MILILGAAGKTGIAVIKALVRIGEHPRALVRNTAQLNRVLMYGARSVMTGDLAEPDSLTRAMEGIRAVYAIFPNIHPDELGLAALAMQAAQNAGVERFVYHSVLHPQSTAMPHHLQKSRVEERLLESGLNYTILQPTVYMQNIIGYRESILNEGKFAIPYDASAKIGMVDLANVAVVAAQVLTDSGHNSASYEMASNEILDQNQIAQQIGKTIKREVVAETVDRTVWEKNARAAGSGDYQVNTLLRMFEYYEDFGFSGNSETLTKLLGCEPTTFAEFCSRELNRW